MQQPRSRAALHAEAARSGSRFALEEITVTVLRVVLAPGRVVETLRRRRNIRRIVQHSR